MIATHGLLLRCSGCKYLVRTNRAPMIPQEQSICRPVAMIASGLLLQYRGGKYRVRVRTNPGARDGRN